MLGWSWLLLLSLLPWAEPATPSPLAARLMPLIQAHEGKVAVAVKHLVSGESFNYHENDVMPTASLIKFAVMVEALRQAESGLVDLSATVTLRESDKVPGSGILTQHFSPLSTFALKDAIKLMIVYSDNTATNLVLDQIGISSTAKTMEQLGYPNTKIHSKVYRRDTSLFPERSVKYGLGSTTAAEMIGLCERLHKRELVSPAASETMYQFMLLCEDPDKFPRFLPHGTKVAMKTGSVNASRTAAGILQTPGGPVALCVMTDENKDQRWHPDNAGDRLCAEIARAVYTEYENQAKTNAGSGSAPASSEPKAKSARSTTPAPTPTPTPTAADSGSRLPSRP